MDATNERTFAIVGYTLLGSIFGALVGYAIGDAAAYKMIMNGFFDVEQLDDNDFEASVSEKSDDLDAVVLEEEDSEGHILDGEVNQSHGIPFDYSKVKLEVKPELSELASKYITTHTMESEIVDPEEVRGLEDDTRLIFEKMMYLADDGIFIDSDGDEVDEDFLTDIFRTVPEDMSEPENWPDGNIIIRNRRIGREIHFVYVSGTNDDAVMEEPEAPPEEVYPEDILDLEEEEEEVTPATKRHSVFDAYSDDEDEEEIVLPEEELEKEETHIPEEPVVTDSGTQQAEFKPTRIRKAATKKKPASTEVTDETNQE